MTINDLTDDQKMQLHLGVCRGMFPARIPLPLDPRTIQRIWNGATDAELQNLVPLEAWTIADRRALLKYRHPGERMATGVAARDRYIAALNNAGGAVWIYVNDLEKREERNKKRREAYAEQKRG